MAAAAPERLGKVPCTACGEPTMVRRSSTGTLSQGCQLCGWSGFVKPGETAHRKLLEALPKPGSPAPEPKPPAAPAPRKGFAMGDL